MINIDPSWRILTIGDGDLAFSASLNSHHHVSKLTATIFDDLDSLDEKYGQQHYLKLLQRNCQVLSQFDVTNPDTWQGLAKNSFDLIIFQFPLIPNDGSQLKHQENRLLGGDNCRNRMLLRKFLQHSFEYFLAPSGASLCMISSKDVKPYRQWNIEQSLTYQLDINYLGQQEFLFEQFPDYQLRNVDRNKFVKNTQAISYFWSDIDNGNIASKLQKPAYLRPSLSVQPTKSSYCAMCRVGPMTTDVDRSAHNESKRHRQMRQLEQHWLALLASQ